VQRHRAAVGGFFHAQGDVEAFEETKNSTFSFITISSLFTGIILISVFNVLMWGRYAQDFHFGIFIISIYLVLHRIYLFYILLLRATKKFTTLSCAVIFDSILQVILVFLLVKNFRLQGMYLTVILSSFLNILYIHWQARIKVTFSINFQRVYSLIKLGLPLVAIGFLGTLLRIQRWNNDQKLFRRHDQ